MGQSGGGAKVCDVLAMPCAEGLVHKVVGLSGNAITASDPEASKALGNAVAAETGASGMMGGFAPIADGEILPKEFFADKNAASAKIPLMLCTTTSEFALSKENPTLGAISFEDAVKMVSENFGQPKAQEAMEALQKAFPAKK